MLGDTSKSRSQKSEVRRQNSDFTFCNERAAMLLDYCLRAEAWPSELLRALADDECSDALFRVVAEGLADRFEPALCDTYAALFAEAIAPGESAALVERYRRVRIPRADRGCANGRSSPCSGARATIAPSACRRCWSAR